MPDTDEFLMFLPADQDPREHGGWEGERATLLGSLRDRRLTFEMKCSGLDAEGLARRAVPPSSLSLLGLLRHLADAERHWFRRVLAGEEIGAVRPGDDAFEGAVADEAVVARAWEQWRTELGHAERFTAGVEDMGTMSKGGETPIALREVLVHLIDEYARHIGHADLLRERVDGRVGE
ncbi:mycothiol transferase [Phytomonospora endophytica]|uniref:Putative damage-inducible protein DinB n=1 Tax=Phytomonospora endophytica TaxID=714109 RepID=A0A841FMJ4_9ACTN|nr:DUF664 domain-containing protein [Phytomonospora endophytica]MBB6033170.1 putative damage-inducible protein DinB [Phytomonospora endophytica]GIG65396.1 hypothetical protein Pen01_16910 [Phytomonospora endophytica]